VFSGIVEAIGNVKAVKGGQKGRAVLIRTPDAWKLRAGESVCIDGVCSTVQATPKGYFRVIYMPETLRRTTLSQLEAGSRMNLERSLTLGSLVGGHLVQGHVDGVARIAAIRVEGDARLYQFKLPARLSRYMVEKGSVAIDGISLTIVQACRGGFSISLLDYTLRHTTLGRKKPGDRVNIEVDLIAKYVENLVVP
jgi:riboflavin synthase